MPSNRINNRRGTLELQIELDGVEQGSAQFKAARKRHREQIRDEVLRLGEQHMLPDAKRVVPSIAAQGLTIRATGGRGSIGVKGKRLNDRIIGLWNFGGKVKTKIVPVQRQALTIRPGVIRASVSTERVHKGKHGLERAIERNLPAYANDLLKWIMRGYSPMEHTP